MADALVDVAARAVLAGLRGRPADDVAVDHLPEDLRVPGASFVTLERDGQLLGCVGSLEPERPLAEDVARSAQLAAFDDPRLPPVTADDYEHMAIKVSVLSPLEEMAAATPRDVLAWLRPGVDGLVLDADGRRATFLPAVWDALPDPGDFLTHLVRKAGLREWPATMRAWRYTTREVSDPGPRSA